ncbi:CHRD domain-containing protein [Kibdelosporangium phytohabitans]|uniref:CHRD domain-containing protein n=1 Tax=Kibdelosporangium phytohabitans TaxID=860235 RepID=UPI00146FE7F5|nr:CHRD domain-containing protein [Kibdelosporangium phytohabitans]MBE1467387.1 hypothetical protein [Kibdelosporangium phytohabitans]
MTGAVIAMTALAIFVPTASASENHTEHGNHSTAGPHLGLNLNLNLGLGISSNRHTRLTGAAEVPGPGDPDGRGQATVRTGRDTVCASVSVRNIQNATAAHIHRGARGNAGPVVVNLTAPSNGRSHTCTPVGRDLAIEIRNHPSRFYVNVHNSEFPAGAIRGQLGR